jgi:hypothetical protein
MTALAALIGAAVLSACPASHVRYVSYPGVGAGLSAVPWIATSNGAFYGHLFYVGGTPWRLSKPVGAHIFTTVKPRNLHPKVLWISRRGAAAGHLVIRGRRLDGPGTFVTRSVNGGAYQFPSYVEIPQAGCWRVSISTAGVSGSVVFVAVDDF